VPTFAGAVAPLDAVANTRKGLNDVGVSELASKLEMPSGVSRRELGSHILGAPCVNRV
jgi:hypothetical protein